MFAVLESGSSTPAKPNVAVRPGGGSEANDSEKLRQGVGIAQTQNSGTPEFERSVEPVSESQKTRPLPTELQSELDRERDISFKREETAIERNQQIDQRLEARRVYEEAIARRFEAQRAYDEARTSESRARINSQDPKSSEAA